MRTLNGIAVTDKVNLYDEIFTLNAMYSAYEDAWDTALPSYINHNHEKSIGFANLTGIFLEPGCAYLTNSVTIGENESEAATIKHRNDKTLFQRGVEDNKEKYDLLIEKLGSAVVGECKRMWLDGVFIFNEGIVGRAIKDLSDKIKNGLIDGSFLNPVLPGVYRFGDYIVCAHLLFRRGYSYLNALNSEFLSKLEGFERENCRIQIALDMDCIGLAGTEQKSREYQYWWGPIFDDNLNSIPLGVTKHVNEHYDKLFSETRYTEFGWYIQDNKHTFECEEITDIPNLRIDKTVMYACRFVHSMVNEKGVPVHLDGAIRAYTDEKMISRLDISIKDCERDTIYTKLWRIDGLIPVAKWKELITHYYRDNMMVGEYFGGKDSKVDSHNNAKDQKSGNEISLKSFNPCNIQKGDGIRIYFSYSKHSTALKEFDIAIRPVSTFLRKEDSFRYVESETVSLFKKLQRDGLKVRFPFVRIVGFLDQVYNYPIFECSSAQVANAFLMTLQEFCKIWTETKDDRVISFSIKIPYGDKSAQFSFLGHVEDFTSFFDAGFSCIPEEDVVLPWLLDAYSFISNHFGPASETHPLEMINTHRTLFVNRVFVPTSYINSFSDDGKVTLELPKAVRDQIIKYKLSAVVAFIEEECVCSKCKADYNKCNCVNITDTGVVKIIQKATPLGITWTNRSALNKRTTLR